MTPGYETAGFPIFQFIVKVGGIKKKQRPFIGKKKTQASWNPANLHVKGPESQPAEGAEEQRRHHDLNDEGSHHAQLLPPHGQLVGEPGERRGDALGLVVVGERCGNTERPEMLIK